MLVDQDNIVLYMKRDHDAESSDPIAGDESTSGYADGLSTDERQSLYD